MCGIFRLKRTWLSLLQPGGRRIEGVKHTARFQERRGCLAPINEFCCTIIQSTDFNPVRGTVALRGGDLKHVLIDLPCTVLEKGREERRGEALIGSVMTCSCSL